MWYVTDDSDGQGPVLHLFTADKSLVVKYFPVTPDPPEPVAQQ